MILINAKNIQIHVKISIIKQKVYNAKRGYNKYLREYKKALIDLYKNKLGFTVAQLKQKHTMLKKKTKQKQLMYKKQHIDAIAKLKNLKKEYYNDERDLVAKRSLHNINKIIDKATLELKKTRMIKPKSYLLKGGVNNYHYNNKGEKVPGPAPRGQLRPPPPPSETYVPPPPPPPSETYVPPPPTETYVPPPPTEPYVPPPQQPRHTNVPRPPPPVSRTFHAAPPMPSSRNRGSSRAPPITRPYPRSAVFSQPPRSNTKSGINTKSMRSSQKQTKYAPTQPPGIPKQKNASTRTSTSSTAHRNTKKTTSNLHINAVAFTNRKFTKIPSQMVLSRQSCVRKDLFANMNPAKPNFSILEWEGNGCYFDSLFMCLFHNRQHLDLILDILFNGVVNDNVDKQHLINSYCDNVSKLHQDLPRLNLMNIRRNLKLLRETNIESGVAELITGSNHDFTEDQMDPGEVLDLINAIYPSKYCNFFNERILLWTNSIPRLKYLYENIDNLNGRDYDEFQELINKQLRNSSRNINANVRNSQEAQVKSLLVNLNVEIDLDDTNTIYHMRNYIPNYLWDPQINENTRGDRSLINSMRYKELIDSEAVLLKFDRTVAKYRTDPLNKRVVLGVITKKIRNIIIPCESIITNKNQLNCISIIIHHGANYNSGHYTCAFKYQGNSRWYMYDDTSRNDPEIIGKDGSFEDVINSDLIRRNSTYFFYVKNDSRKNSNAKVNANIKHNSSKTHYKNSGAAKSSNKQFKGLIYDSTSKTDFSKMILKPENFKSLFIYNENENQFLSASKAAGGVNAEIRPYRVDANNLKRQKNSGSALGIPTGNNAKGYEKLTDNRIEIINIAIKNIDTFMTEHNDIPTVYWSATSDGSLGTGIFNVSDSVKQYIVDSLKQLAVKHNFEFVI